VYTLDYLVEKFQHALLDLATGEGDARSRVDSAYRRFWAIRIGDFPEHLRKDREAIDKLLTRLPGREGYIIPDNLRRMTNKTASKICTLIYELYFGLVEVQRQRRRLDR